jgi:HPt (histidine-containing phosphotransfer) domain-containing protein
MSESSQQRFAELQARYSESLPAKHAALALAWHALTTLGGEQAVANLQALTHRLAGSAPSYGYDTVGERARAVDVLLNAWIKQAPAKREDANALGERVSTSMRALLDSVAEAIDPPPRGG